MSRIHPHQLCRQSAHDSHRKSLGLKSSGQELLEAKQQAEATASQAQQLCAQIEAVATSCTCARQMHDRWPGSVRAHCHSGRSVAHCHSHCHFHCESHCLFWKQEKHPQVMLLPDLYKNRLRWHVQQCPQGCDNRSALVSIQKYCPVLHLRRSSSLKPNLVLTDRAALV